MTTSKFKINYLPELSALIFGRIKPSMVSVNLTEKCNLDCIYCEINNNPLSQSKEILTKNDLYWIIDQMSKNKITRLSMCGGEPFLFDDIIDVVDYAWKKNIRSNITTNGMTVHKLNDSEFKILKECETELNISVDSFQNGIQTQTRGNDLALSNAIKSIQILIKKGIPVTVLSVISKYNYLDLSNSLIKAYENGIRQVLYQPIIYYSNYPDKPAIENKSLLNVSNEGLDILMNQLQKIRIFESKHKIKTNVYRILPWISYYIKNNADFNRNSFYFNILKNFYCREVYEVIEINYYGGIQPCGLSHAEISIFNKRELSLLDLWSEANCKLKDDLKNKNYPQYCNGCCHKFSRNMIASVIKYPISNRIALVKLLYLIITRMITTVYKILFIKD
jgi:MoaA/NifB/PqqE/SkfB family radical SAM enzyme